MSLLDDFIEDCKVRGLTAGSIRSYKGTVGTYLQWMEEQGLDPVTANGKEMRGFVTHLRDAGKSPKTLENYFASISSFYEFLLYEELVTANPVLPVRKRYLRKYKENGIKHERKLISVEDMAMLVHSITNKRDRALIVLLAKTGIRREELVQIDVDDINWEEGSILLKPHPKRTNRRVYFDPETTLVLKRWLRARESLVRPGEKALLVGAHGQRLERNGVYLVVIQWAERVGLHNPDGEMEDKFTPHCCRHWFTTHLRRNGMEREMIKELRGDASRDAMDIYYHIDPEELKKQYLARIPSLGI